MEIYLKTENELHALDDNSIEFALRAEQDANGNNIADTYAEKRLYGKSTINVGRESDSEIGYCSCAINIGNKASGVASHAEGKFNSATGQASHAEGWNTIASGYCSHAEGMNTIASGESSHASGKNVTVTNSHSYACGHYNANMINSLSIGTAFAIGNGESDSACSNAFSVTFGGITKSASTITAETTADYAEFFEWEDGNLNSEDRVGKFVTLHEDKIAIASNEDYILGIISGAPFVLGNGDCDVWTGMWLRDDFGRIIYEPAPKMKIDEETGAMKEVFDEDGNLIYEGKRRKLNPNYDPTQKYVSRFDRPEWAAVGMLGVFSVIQDGTCEVNGYCCCNEDGIATACDKNTENSYRVIKKISDHVVRVVFR